MVGLCVLLGCFLSIFVILWATQWTENKKLEKKMSSLYIEKRLITEEKNEILNSIISDLSIGDEFVIPDNNGWIEVARNSRCVITGIDYQNRKIVAKMYNQQGDDVVGSDGDNNWSVDFKAIKGVSFTKITKREIKENKILTHEFV